MKSGYLRDAIKCRVFFRSVAFYAMHKLGTCSWYTAGRLQMESIYKKYSKKIAKRIQPRACYENEEHGENRTMWVYWRQGYDNAPPIVKKCIDCMRALHEGKWKVVVLDEQNLSSYVQMPQELEKLRAEGKLGEAAWSDLVRLKLLYEQGGAWIDATCLFFEQLPSFVTERELFVFSSGYRGLEFPNFQSWLIYAKKGCPLIGETYRLTNLFAQKYHGFPHYFFMFFVFQTVSEAYREDWERVIPQNELNSYNLQFKLKEEFSEAEYEAICKSAFVHKLTYKGLTEEDYQKEGTYLAYIMQRK